MIDAAIVLVIICCYLVFLFMIALLAERMSARGKSLANHPLVYSLSLAVYCTAWTYYGSVGKAATSGVAFLPIYLGPSLSILLWWTVLRKMVRIKVAYHITTIADFISVRYGKSQLVAALVTVITITGIMPYIALQLKAIISSFLLITQPVGVSYSETINSDIYGLRVHAGVIIVALMIAFTIIVGVRRLDPTERHEGMVIALAVECVVKLFAFLAAGIFVTYVVFDGFGDILQRIQESPLLELRDHNTDKGLPFLTWTSYLILSMSAILFLPRQFHVAVVENHNERHILTAMWVFPLYMLMINIFVFPIALGGLLSGLHVSDADTFVLRLPMQQARPWLALLVFIGGFSAGAGMIMICSITIATMVSNYLVLPFVESMKCLGFLRHHLLRTRWVIVASLIGIGYWSMEHIFEYEMLVNIGLISFAAILQFAPPILGGIFWRRANKAGALLGMGAGFVIWCHTQLLPSFIRKDWLPRDVLDNGPWGISILRSEGLFGLSGLDPLSHTVLWSLLFNVCFFVMGSLLFDKDESEHGTAEGFVGILGKPGFPWPRRHGDAYIDLPSKLKEIKVLLEQYFSAPEAETIIARSLQQVGVERESHISILKLIEFHDEVEKCLSGAIGAASAHKALRQRIHFSSREARDLSEVYAEILSDLKVTPSDLKRRIDYYQEREQLLMQQASELENKVEALGVEIHERQTAQAALRESEERYRGLIETMNEALSIEDEQGRVVYVNDRFCTMFGCMRVSIIGNRMADLVDSAQWNTVRVQIEKCMRGELGCFEATWTLKDGRTIWTIMSPVPLSGGKPGSHGSFAVYTDISSLKTLEREKSNIISMLAHDMRSSLTGIHGLALRLLTKWRSMEEERLHEHLQIINRESGKLESLIDDFLEFSRIEVGRLKLNFRAVSLDRELLEIHEVYRTRAAQREIGVELKADEPLPIIEADVNRLRRVLTNLLDNAMKFSGDGSTITITAQETEREIVVSVKDEGCGINQHEIPFIFDLFHRGMSEGKKEGYGIGLATVKAIVEGHGGRVYVTSNPGSGSIFTVCLPKRRESKSAEE